MKPFLAGKMDPEKLVFPVIVQPKLDGIRACVVEGKLVSRSLKAIPNLHIRSLLEDPLYEGLDGELILGDPTASDCYRKTNSAVMSSDGEPGLTYYVFDIWDHLGGYESRHHDLCNMPLPECAQIVPNTYAQNQAELDEIEATLINAGHEGGILRGPKSLYKFGRGTATKGDLIKLKRFVDSEAEVLDVIEELHNANEAITNELGRTARSSHKVNKQGKGTMGALLVTDMKTGVNFKVGTGFDAEERATIWQEFQADRGSVVGSIIRYKSFPVGVKVAPRHPVFLGFRHPDDMS